MILFILVLCMIFSSIFTEQFFHFKKFPFSSPFYDLCPFFRFPPYFELFFLCFFLFSFPRMPNFGILGLVPRYTVGMMMHCLNPFTAAFLDTLQVEQERHWQTVSRAQEVPLLQMQLHWSIHDAKHWKPHFTVKLSYFLLLLMRLLLHVIF